MKPAAITFAPPMASVSFSGAASGRSSVPAGPPMPLSLAKPGSTLTVRKVRGGAASKHLASLGFVEGAQVRVVNQTSTGTIASVKGAQLGLDKDTARQVMCIQS